MVAIEYYSGSHVPLVARYLVLLLILMAGCSSFRPGWVHPNSFTIVDGDRLPGTFDEDGNYIPENPEIEWTYQIPDISTGFIFDVNSMIDEEHRRDVEFISPALQIELFEFDSHIPYVSTLKIDFGVAYQRAYLYVGKLWTSIFEISTGVFGGWNFKNREPSYGIAIGIIKF